MSGGKGGTKSAQVEFPYYAEGAARDLVRKGRIAADMPYAPYSGPDVAAFTPAQVAAMQSAGKAAEAYGIIGKGQTPRIVGDPTAGGAFRGGFMDATNYGGGVRGHSSLPLFQQSVANLETLAPNYMDMYRQMYPVTDSENLPYYYPAGYEGQIYSKQPSFGGLPADFDYARYFSSGFFG
jgi:hypothetical protein